MRNKLLTAVTAIVTGAVTWWTGNVVYGMGAGMMVTAGALIGMTGHRRAASEVTSARKDTIPGFLARRKNATIYRPDDLPPSGYEPTDQYRKD